MTLALVASLVIALAVFLFVLEPVIRARADQVTLDEVALPLPPKELDAGEALIEPPFETDDTPPATERPAARAALDRPAGSDVT